jgi:hypothetical protein
MIHRQRVVWLAVTLAACSVPVFCRLITRHVCNCITSLGTAQLDTSFKATFIFLFYSCIPLHVSYTMAYLFLVIFLSLFCFSFLLLFACIRSMLQYFYSISFCTLQSFLFFALSSICRFALNPLTFFNFSCISFIYIYIISRCVRISS